MISGRNISEKLVVTGLLAMTAAAILLTAGLNNSALNINSNQAVAQQQQQQQQQLQTNNTIRVAAGGGNATARWTIFVPQVVEVKTGQSVTWYNPTQGAAEPHTVTFVLDNNTMTGVVSPLAVSNTTKFMPLPPNSNNEPVLLPDETGSGMNTIIAINSRTYEPVTIDSNDSVKFMNPNANYSMTGTEKYVNSGWSLPPGQEQAYPGSGNSFTVTFERSGTYYYLCLLHPWMTGSVVAK